MSLSAVGVLFWVAVAFCVVAQIAITRAAALDPKPVATEGDVPLPHRASEVAWALVPAVMLAMVLLLTWNQIRLSGEAARDLPPAAVPAGGGAHHGHAPAS
jgi:heme/copper-type cytochrome/quinol oxidase subunit 2